MSVLLGTFLGWPKLTTDAGIWSRPPTCKGW